MSLSCRNLKCVSPLRRRSGGDASTQRRARAEPPHQLGAPLGVGRRRARRDRKRSQTGATAIARNSSCGRPYERPTDERPTRLGTVVVSARGAARIARRPPLGLPPGRRARPRARRRRRRPVAGRACATGAGKPLGVATWAAQAAAGAAHGRARAASPRPTDLMALVAERLDAALARRRGADAGPRRLSRRPRRERLPARAGRRSLRRRGGHPDHLGGDERARAPRSPRSCASGSARASSSRATTARRATSRGCRASRASSRARATTRVVYRLGPQPARGRPADATARPAASSTRPTTTRRSRRWRRAGARALDAFTYHGGFALALARRGGEVLAIDEDAAAVARAAANARRNGLANIERRARQRLRSAARPRGDAASASTSSCWIRRRSPSAAATARRWRPPPAPTRSWSCAARG